MLSSRGIRWVSQAPRRKTHVFMGSAGRVRFASKLAHTIGRCTSVLPGKSEFRREGFRGQGPLLRKHTASHHNARPCSCPCSESLPANYPHAPKCPFQEAEGDRSFRGRAAWMPRKPRLAMDGPWRRPPETPRNRGYFSRSEKPDGRGKPFGYFLAFEKVTRPRGRNTESARMPERSENAQPLTGALRELTSGGPQASSFNSFKCLYTVARPMFSTLAT
ncbi:hypothetical protein HNP46_003462 [Pseudomonas nitritireducens]|uniref:Uncharacterized protein n=1 Tax=Pseudomonas nitroreducens TaxID=46680 RepID=A0A7W7P1J3_PSENT|nr:hypothetical protein [Pseudomonas nitritireducens]